MNVEIDGVVYLVSMKWNPDNTLVHYVEIGGKYHNINYDMVAIPRDQAQTATPPQELRDTFASKIKIVLDTLSGDRRS